MIIGTQREETTLKVLQKYAPALFARHEKEDGDGEDSAIVEYILQILNDQDSFADVDGLQETLATFLDGDREVANQIVQALQPVVVDDIHASEISKPLTLGQLETVPHDSTIHGSDVGVKQHVENLNEYHPEKKSTAKDRRLARQQRKKEKKKAEGPSGSDNTEAPVEDDASAWQECQEQGLVWGGRGHGGRGEYSGAVNHIKSNIHLTNVSVSLPNGTELLSNGVMDIQKGHRYGLIGRNGSGKSTLLKRLAQKAIPGMPHDMRILLVQQQVDGSDETPVRVLLKADTERLELLQEQERLESMLEDSDELSNSELASMAERLGDIAGELDAIEAEKAEERALEILKGLQFTEEMLSGPTENLSGGWRMRLGLARALFVQSDLLLLDEASNHMDLQGLAWLIRYLVKDKDRTMILVSHDRSFLDAVCTDIMHLNHQKLKYHVGNLSDFERQQADKSARESQILDAAERKRSKAEAFVQKQQSLANKKSADPNKQRQAKMIKEKKMDRIGNYREDGKRYKLMSMAKMGMEYTRLAEKVVIEVEEPIVKMHFSDPTWPPGIGAEDVIVRLDSFCFAYNPSAPRILENNTLSLSRSSKAALVGRNGAGKSTLMRLVAREMDPKECFTIGGLWHHPSLRIGHITQYSVEELEHYAQQTVLEYAEEKFRNGRASSTVISKACGNLRQYLGAFGLGGSRHALQPIGKLSGGERMRLCFATVLAEEPHLLLLDEATNHCDYETLDSLSQALNEYKGSVLMVSHNQSFLSGFCTELWVLESGETTVNHSDTESFDELFADYRATATGGIGSQSLSDRRREQANMAKQASQQRANTRQTAALI